MEVTVTTLQRLVDGTWKGSFEFKSKDLAEVDQYVDKKVHLFKDAPKGDGQTLQRVEYLLQTVATLLDVGASKRRDEDLMTLALRLYGEDPSTYSPETAEVMDRMRPEIERILSDGNCVVHSSWDRHEQAIPKYGKDIAAHIPVGDEKPSWS
jgi:hypothetical protein